MKRFLIVICLTITRSLTTSFLIDDLCAGVVDLLQTAKQTTASSLAALEVCQTSAQQLVSILSKDYRKAWGYSVLHLRLVFGVLSLMMLFICIFVAGFGACVGGCSLLENRISLCMILSDTGVEGSSFLFLLSTKATAVSLWMLPRQVHPLLSGLAKASSSSQVLCGTVLHCTYDPCGCIPCRDREASVGLGTVLPT